MSLELTRSVSHHPSVTKPAPDIMQTFFSSTEQRYINFHRNIEDDEMILKVTMEEDGHPKPSKPDNG